MFLKKGKLLINNEPYKKKIEPPSVETIVRPPLDQIVKAKKVHLLAGQRVEMKGSSFIGYAMAYLQLCKKYAKAAHVMCAYNIPGKHNPYHCDYADDGQHGVGQAIFEYIMEQSIPQNNLCSA